ncbi:MULTISPECIES: bifunctional tRNA (5-methylaminomethyl-2-thiouridine)(34)-methyltransferase MnmD/FAD-dependent 5-carboxymethylaminomethyl-2-thiouridine(34) oxidoreductase MnmC [unclassified Photobacterium]|uniref:bifunctional tRNA (5-methylaminomethyl-2-thiouridine)(34)-methyltransferase MnmD/FAD-dependent 5-carboxymethylaminomethyl-2-thiouridine(34) oxidoreductase MnmC n=1 Tax=unclassified Photobacterium TaxID=2628852 RepID=UPI000D177B20|nr:MULTISPECIES: bifunctional tRNA (5-methylaminomethyl-2-thiouridine)(34)-methyltransferase MnmD/FAD-dependent 5-carboxymethylaminomethyl-2-thiouridine(34) oxidoreductase MnmC [unclassified Photobacterium]PSV24663.1 bifunctional tRNA (5-methylaminomethyl-2-thiouridine)(34)-methyltransferase MnmD/FAD-dependent 5-carboxymethylaminomethyl-2-thiouridine(34) oxidoreductase MnmC [Photobacterium sp. GB-56]PSV58560.1 bifunctional tRNA (5-methylaminomethyl-2-thiouridine)(34)-methyltransferase MnmD/FAD-de
MSSSQQEKSPLQIENAVLDWNDVGTPVSNNFDDVYFSNVNGLEETRYVFIKQNGLPERWIDGDRRRFVIAETGFGTGLNFLAVWKAFKDYRSQYPDATTTELHFISFEKFPVTQQDLIKAHQAWPELAELAEQLHAHYPPAIADCHRIVLEDGMITLDLWFGDIKDCMPQVWVGDEGIVDAWFLDGFAPSKNPEMWNQNLFNGMVKMARKDCSVATFTAAGFVRRGLIEAGFDMRKTKGFGTKRDMIVGHVVERQHKTNIMPWYNREAQTEPNANIAIIGGGIASATTALALLRRGQNVTLYCADNELAEGASGNRQGAVYPLLNGNNDKLSRFFSSAFIYARQLIEQAAIHSDFSHNWCGVTQLAWDDKSSHKLANIINGGFASELVHHLDKEQTKQITGIETGFESVHYPLGGWLSPKELTTALIEHAVNEGKLTLQTQKELCQLEQVNKTQWQLTFTDGSETRHSTVILANGHRFNQYPQTQQIPASSVRGQVSHVPTNPSLGELKTVLCYDGYLTPINPENQSHCIGASYDRRNIDLNFNENDQQDNKQRLVNCLPNVEWPKQIDIDGFDVHNRARVGIRCAVRDHLPYVGNVCRYDDLLQQYDDLRDNQTSAKGAPIYSNLFAIVGLGSRGLSSAPLLGELLASQICGDPLPLPLDVLGALHPGRMWVRKLLKGKAIQAL